MYKICKAIWAAFFLNFAIFAQIALAISEDNEKYASLVVNAENGEVLYQSNADKHLHPASLTKMMTIYITLDSLKTGKLSLNQILVTSQKAASMPRTNLNLRPGQKISVRDALSALIVHSANDAAVVLAEAQGGSIDAFAYQMNQVAKALGMDDTNFENPHGLHNEAQITTAFDMAKLAIALRRDHADYYQMFSKKSFAYNGRVFNSHNNVLKRYKYADGIKTGFINASGFNLVTSTTSPYGKLVGVVFGGPSAMSRDKHMIELLERGYKQLASSKNLYYESEISTGEILKTKDIAKLHRVKSKKIKSKRRKKRR